MHAFIASMFAAPITHVFSSGFISPHMPRQSFFSGSPRMSGGLRDAIFSTTFSQSGSAAFATGAAGAADAATDEAVVVPVAPLEELLSQAKTNIERVAARTSVIFMVTADTAPPLPTFRFRWLKAVRSA